MLINNPLVAGRSCEICLKMQFDENTGKIVIHPPHTGEPVRRIGKPPCQTFVGCAKGSPTAGKELTARNWQAYKHYKECEAVGQFPDDAIVRRNAAIIKSIEDTARRREQIQLAGLRI